MKGVSGFLFLETFRVGRHLIRRWFLKGLAEPKHPLRIIIDNNVRGIWVLRNLSGSDARGGAGSAKPKAHANPDGGGGFAQTLGARARSIPATWGTGLEEYPPRARFLRLRRSVG